MDITMLRKNLRKQGLSETDVLLAIEAIDKTLKKQKTKRLLITMDGGVIQALDSTFQCDIYVLDFDDEDGEQELIDSDGDPINASFYDVECEINPERISHFIKQI